MYKNIQHITYIITNGHYKIILFKITQALKLISHSIRYLTFSIINTNITKLHVKFFYTKRYFHSTLCICKHK